ncbi:MAG: nitrous oxide reductase accessory protein NosL [Sulfurimonas sp.]|nr:nitrous oxide reductase accessory protein NosL [Sulfurimonas sp.]
MIKIISILIILLNISCLASEQDRVIFQSVSKKTAILLKSGDEKESCSRCGMNLVRFYKTSHSAIIDKKAYQYCSFHCLVDHLSEGRSLDDPKVIDTKLLKFIDIRAAYYVVGSKIKGTMTDISKYAFSVESDAKEFKNKNGGEIMNFFKAMEIAKKDFQ